MPLQRWCRMPVDTEPMLERARAHERSGDYVAAFHAYWRAADLIEEVDRRSFVRMQAVRSLQRGDAWRAESGSWESLGNELGRELDRDRTDGRELYDGILLDGSDSDAHARLAARRHDGQYNTVSDWQWDESPAGAMEAADTTSSIDRTSAERRHRQAWAYEWAAESAISHNQFADAARLYRRAGLAWETSLRANRFHRAAACYHSAALCSTRTSRIETKRMVVGRWCPWCVREKETEALCPRKCSDPSIGRNELDGSEALAEPWDTLSDIERIDRCWSRAAEHSTAADRRRLRDHRDRQLADVQRHLAREGNKADARTVRRFRTRSSYRLRVLPGPLLTAAAYATTSAMVLALLLLAVYVVVLPLAWWAPGVLHVHGVAAPAPFATSIVFSLQSVMTMSNGYFAPGGSIADAAQGIEAVSAYFALGAVLWVALRSYED